VSLRPVGSDILGTRVEIKNLNSFRSMERAIRYQLELQQETLELGKQVEQETLGWDDLTGATYSQRSKEDSHDYRYFPEPDLPPLIVSREWIERVRSQQPELPREKAKRFEQQYRIKRTESILLVEDAFVAEFFEKAVASSPETEPGTLAKWMIGDVFARMKENGSEIADIKASPESFAKLVGLVQREEINQATGKKVLARLLMEGGEPEEIISTEGLQQVSDIYTIKNLVAEVLTANPGAVEKYRSGKPTVEQWLFGQVMRVAEGKANPALVKAELNRQLSKPG
jgi:aspartyl-tRNA(Asn)/glutamyl-tRNA(Gln) amidotransferase subunit B